MSKLKHAPLQEVIFEILWEVEYNEKGMHHDPDFALAQGIFAKEMSTQFPIRKKILPDELIDKIYPVAVYQFWKNDNQWPVVQIGPGIMALNDTDKNYDWENNFYSQIKTAIDLLEKSYGKNLIYKRASLRYIDAVDINGIDAVDFINKNFKIAIQNNYETFGKPLNINFSQTFNIDETSLMNFSITEAANQNNQPSVIWQTQVFTESKLNRSEVIKWVDNAHQCASTIFKNSLNDEFYSSFK